MECNHTDHLPLIVPSNKHSHGLFACNRRTVGRSGPAEAWTFFDYNEFDVRESKIRDDLRAATARALYNFPFIYLRSVGCGGLGSGSSVLEGFILKVSSQFVERGGNGICGGTHDFYSGISYEPYDVAAARYYYLMVVRLAGSLESR